MRPPVMARLMANGLLFVGLALGATANAAPAPSVAAGHSPASPAVVAPKAQLKVVELAIETVAGSVLLPSGTVGNVVVTACGKCAPVSLLATSSTQYFVARSQVSMADLRQALAGQPDAEVVVFYDVKTHELTRVRANVSAGTPNAAPLKGAGLSGSARPNTTSDANGSAKR